MKPLLLHGLAIKASRIKLLEIKKKFPSDNVMEIEKGEDISVILTNLQSQSLFNTERLIVLENPPEDLSFQELDPETSLVIWFDHEVSRKKKIMLWAEKNTQILFFPEGKEITVFPFLDALASKDKKAFLIIASLKEKGGYDIFYFLTMALYLLRSLAVISKNAPSFIRQKMERQRKNFSDQEIKQLYKFVLETEFKLKNGLLDQSQAEFLLVSRFIST